MMDEKIEKYNIWNEKKKILNFQERNLFFKEGEIWWCSLGVNIGEEVYGKGREFRRPVVVLKKLSRNTCIILPLTTQDRKGSWYFHTKAQNIDRWAMMHQIRFISANRFYTREASVSSEEFFELKKSLAVLLGLLIKSSPDGCLDQWEIPNIDTVYSEWISNASDSE